ncbi:DegT/DnrJ/EryC1/StrS family aminotransferase [Pseudalkalibacillus hwajinpoensis]|uniref:Aminotransferase class I/II-fold pyridoxal phosphate-dependent enzyme n=1 Tax=Guptibacillus hwajinpoensis TaxID=208199 RepID=A0A4U1MJP2_9BACL|nr:aminotransferase class I/II-fold pyridoxal phosphate-dependent enzyme [Pseudalkalibacillus hwajinpoensis]TKD70814.1 aminotransferase class I/II-fold pyridoxal phosphate-dependent enzyme [Pseudalkalibacillus hwajinpoensis]
MNRHKRIYLSPPHMTGREQHYISQAFDSNWIAPLGPNVDAFENAIKKYANVEGALAVSSGTAAIHLALRLVGIEPGDHVFCSSFTFVASANPILYEGGIPTFIDSEPETWNMSPEALLEAFKDAAKENKLPKAVVVVHLYGQSAKMDDILAICDYYKVPVIEDAAESLGSLYKNKQSGTLGAYGVYSFNGNKIISTSGGGMLVTNDLKAIDQARFLATQARDKALHYQHSQIGHNYRMSNILAGMGIAQVEVINERVKQKREVFTRYKEAFKGMEGILFKPEAKDTVSNRWLTTMNIDPEYWAISPEELVRALEEENIEARPVWKPLHLQPLFQNNRFYKHSSECVCEKLYRTGICLPSGTSMSEEEQQRVITLLLANLDEKVTKTLVHVKGVI